MEEIEAVLEACKQVHAELQELQSRHADNPEFKELVSRHAWVCACVEKYKDKGPPDQG